jgi:hypothetical protein
MNETVNLPDGLYQVRNAYLCAGFVVEGGRVTACAPILRRKIRHWVLAARKISIDAGPGLLR